MSTGNFQQADQFVRLRTVQARTANVQHDPPVLVGQVPSKPAIHLQESLRHRPNLGKVEHHIAPLRQVDQVSLVFGGQQNLDHHIYWYETRSLSVVDYKDNWNGQTRLRQGENFDLETAFNKAKFFKLPETVGDPCDGCVRYFIAALDPKENTPHFVTVYEGSVPQRLQEFIDLAITHTADAKAIE